MEPYIPPLTDVLNFFWDQKEKIKKDSFRHDERKNNLEIWSKYEYGTKYAEYAVFYYPNNTIKQEDIYMFYEKDIVISIHYNQDGELDYVVFETSKMEVRYNPNGSIRSFNERSEDLVAWHRAHDTSEVYTGPRPKIDITDLVMKMREKEMKAAQEAREAREAQEARRAQEAREAQEARRAQEAREAQEAQRSEELSKEIEDLEFQKYNEAMKVRNLIKSRNLQKALTGLENLENLKAQETLEIQTLKEELERLLLRG